MTKLNLDTLILAKGGHDSPDDGACLLEAASMLAGEPFGDMPVCVSPVLIAYGQGLNDALPDDKRQLLKPYVPQLLNTAGDGLDEVRGYLALDWLIRVYTPAWLRLVPALTAQADLLAQHPPIVDLETAAHVGDIVREAASQASAAYSAAYSAADSAARSALAPTVDALQDSAISLLGTMIAPKVSS